MTKITEELVLKDRFTNTFKSYTRQANQAAASTNMLRSAIARVGAIASLGTIAKTLVSVSDNVTQITARLDRMNDGLQTTDELIKMVYASANDARGSFNDMAAVVARIGNNAGEAFGGNTQAIVDFANLLQKDMALAGASTAEASNAMLQLSQALGSGVLRGDEFNSIMENAPIIAQQIAKELGVSTGQLRKMAQEGEITAGVVRDAIFNAADDINAEFEKMPMTWGQAWTVMKNHAQQALQPVLTMVNWLANNMDIIAPIVLAAAAAVAVYTVAVHGAEWATKAWAVAQGIVNALMAANPITLIIMGIIALIGVIVALVNHFGWAGDAGVSVTGIIMGAFYTMGAFIYNNVIVPLWNAFAMVANFIANVFSNPVAAVKVLFYDMCIRVLGFIRSLAEKIQWFVNKIPGVEIDLTSGLTEAIGRAEGFRQQVKDESGYNEIFQMKDKMSYSDAWSKGYSKGSTMFSGGGYSSGIGSYTMPELSNIADNTNKTAKSAAKVAKDVDMADEQLKSLVDMAERKYVNNINLTSQTPVVTINGANTGDTEADRRALGELMKQILVEQWASGSLTSTALV